MRMNKTSNKAEIERNRLLNKYKKEMLEDYDNCPEFVKLCVNSEPEFAIRVIRSLYEKENDQTI